MKRFLLLTLFTVLVPVLTSCGGGGDFKPVRINGVDVSCSSRDTEDGVTFLSESGSKGDIGIDCDNDEGLYLKNDMPSLNLNNLKLEINIDASCGNESASITGLLDYKTGKLRLIGNSSQSAVPINCMITFPAVGFPTTITNPQSIENLIDSLDMNNTLSNTCPANIDHESTQLDSNTNCSGSKIDGFFDFIDENNNSHEVVFRITVQ